MNTRIVRIIISLGLFVILTGVAVNAQDINLRAKIPFEFVVGNVTMPAGDYDVTKLSIGSGVFRVRAPKGEYAAMGLVMATRRREGPATTVLVFNRYQENGGEVSHFLSKVWLEWSDTGYEFPKFRAEREAELRAARRDIITLVVPRTNRGAE